jgi:hypothetical protein
MTLRSLMQYLATLSFVILCIVFSGLILKSYACDGENDVVFVGIINCPVCNDSENRYACQYDGFEVGCESVIAGCPDDSMCHFQNGSYCNDQAPVANLKESLLPRNQIAAFKVMSLNNSPPTSCDAPFWSWINRYSSIPSHKRQDQGGL